MKKNLKVKAVRTIKTSGYNPYQTGHGVWENRCKKRSYQKQETRKLINSCM